MEEVEASTWTTETTTEEESITIPPGRTVVCWQYVFTTDLDGDQISFQSTMFKDTNDCDKTHDDMVPGEN